MIYISVKIIKFFFTIDTNINGIFPVIVEHYIIYIYYSFLILHIKTINITK